ncbi:MAG: hypothetical protein J7518_10380 [Nocardioidaceae bacterium]|nr:hypothetical protein [Nocardioidaceae bacterium]
MLIGVAVRPAVAADVGAGWSAAGPGATLLSDGSTASPSFRYSTMSQGKWTFLRTATQAGTITLPWWWSGENGVSRASRMLSLGVFKGGNLVKPQVLVNKAGTATGPSTFTESGKATLTVAAGDTFGFQLEAGARDSASTISARFVLPKPPTVTVPTQPVTATTTDETGTAVTYAASATDEVDGTIPVSCTPASGTKFPLGDTGVTCSATSSTQQTTTASFVVRVFFDEPNVAWPKAALMGGADQRTGTIRTIDTALWYKFPVQPDTVVQVDLKNLPANYDLTLFGDIGQAFSQALSVRDLNHLSAEFAADAFSPSAYSPSAFSPSAFSPSAFSPSAYSPSAFSPSAFSPSAYSPSAYSPSAFSPSAYSPSAYSPSAYSPAVSLPSAFSPSAFSPSAYSDDELRQAYSSAQTRTLIAVSSRDGLADEQIRANTWSASGFFYVRVQGRNGTFAPGKPFTVTTSGASGACAAPMQDFGTQATFRGSPGTARTVILTDSARMTNAPLAALQGFAARPEIGGVVVDAATIPRVQSLQAQADQLRGCPYAKNLVAQELRRVVNSYRDAAGTLKYVVIAGGDDVVPFFRSADAAGIGPEQGYVPPVDDLSASQAALRRNQVLSQDAYGAATDVTLKGATLPVPDLAVGRLVETPAQITGALNRYAALSGGVLPTRSALVTGYDFLTDAADQATGQLEAGLGAGRTDQLITDRDVAPGTTTVGGVPDRRHSWTADDLRSAFLGKRHDVVLLAGHFSANSALAADDRTQLLTTEVRDSAADLTNALVMSLGCHSGYNIVDSDAIPGLTEKLDWAQLMAEKGAVLLGGTGYQYGDTDLLEYSERLYNGVLHELRTGTGAVALGDALVRAKQDYLATTPVISGIHQKALLEATLFGLPMIGVNLPSGRITDPNPGTVNPAAVSSGPGAVLGLRTFDLNAHGATTLVTQPFDDVDNTGKTQFTYLRGVDGVTTSPGQPALPLESFDVGAAGLALRGVGFRGGTYTDTPGIVPLTGAPSSDLSEVHTRFSSPVFFPRRLGLGNTYGALGGDGGTRLLVTAAQHRSDAAFTSTLRRYSSLDFRLLYSGNTQVYNGNTPALAAPPAISSVTSTVSGSQVQVVARVVGDPSAGIQSVWLTRTAETGPWYGAWTSLDLTQDTADSTRWTGTLTLPAGQAAADVRFVLQAANGVGLVTLEDNQAREFIPGVDPAAITQTGDANSTLVLDAPASAVLGDTVPVTATLTGASPLNGRTVLFALGGATKTAKTDSSGIASVSFPIVEQPGSQQLSATFDGDAALRPASAQRVIAVAKRPTSITLTGPPGAVFSGDDTGVSALLRSGTTPITDRSVLLVVRDAGGAVVAAAARRTGPDGRAALGAVALPAGTLSVTAFFGSSGVDVGGGNTSGSVDPENAASVSAPLSLQVKQATTPAITTTSLPDARAGQPYQATVAVTGDPPPTVTVTGLPSGLTYAGGSISGTTTAAGTYTVTVTATNRAGAATRQLTLVVQAAAPAAVVTISGSGQATTFGTVFAAALVVRVTDTFGNTVPGASVTFSSPATGAGTNPRTVTAVTGADGRASVTPTANSTIGSYDVVAAVTGAGSTTFRLANWYALSAFSAPFTAPDGGFVDLPATTNAPLSVQISDANGPTPLLGGVVGALGCRVTLTDVFSGKAWCMGFDLLSARFVANVNGSTLGWASGQVRALRVDVWNGAEVQGSRLVRVRVQ